MAFSVNDEILCVDAKGEKVYLTTGKTYIVKDIARPARTSFVSILDDRERLIWAYADRFIIATSLELTDYIILNLLRDS